MIEALIPSRIICKNEILHSDHHTRQDLKENANKPPSQFLAAAAVTSSHQDTHII